MRSAVLFSALGAVLALWPALARSADAPARSPTERREELQRLSDDLNSPDPLKRLTTLDAVLQSNDLLAREIATRTALSSTDTEMRNYAALLLLSRTKVVNVELKLPLRLQGQVDEAKDDPAKLSAISRTIRFTWADQYTDGGVIAFQFHDFDLSAGTFKSTCENDPQPKDFDGQITGAALQFRGQCAMRAGGTQMCSATMQLQPEGVFAGSFACRDMEIPLVASFRLQ
ncbi:MAG: hypothetical protein JO157_14230 [Acetobacteraceae bacterium]|nr:hypothetical protein [Acetobacteraceae bacterium]